MSRSGWVVLGLVLGAIAIPALAVAATATLVSIRGNNHTAFVTPANQLRTADADPAANFRFEGRIQGLTSIICDDLGVPSASQAVVFKQLNLVANKQGSTQPVHFADVYLSSNCTGTKIGGSAFAAAGAQPLPLGSGVTVPAGAHLSMEVEDVDATADLYGYTAPAAAAPAASRGVTAKTSVRRR